jgi:uncharacterized membrane protein
VFPWPVLALTTAFTEGTKDVFIKFTLKQLDPARTAATSALLTALVLLPVSLSQPWPDLDRTFGLTLLADGSLNTLAFWLYSRALQSGDLSLAAPIVNLTPLFMLITSPLILGERIQGDDLWGVLLISAGAYALNWTAQQQSLWAPLVALWQQPASRLMLIVAMLWSITANLDKVGVQHSSPLLWVTCVFSFMGVSQLGLIQLLAPSSQPLPCQQWPWDWLLLIGLFMGISVGSQMYALTLTNVVNVIALKRLSTLLGVGYGALFFGERQIRNRFFGACLMVLGAILVL